MILLLTGTPGTGKTSVAEAQDRFEVVDLKDFARERGLGHEEDEFVVETEAVQEELNEELEGGTDYVLEGHFAHELKGDVCVVLRCEPSELEERLSARGYSDEKVDENLEAEGLDLVLQEAARSSEKIIEIDTTGRTPDKSATEMVRRVEKQDYGFGNVDYSSWL